MEIHESKTKNCAETGESGTLHTVPGSAIGDIKDTGELSGSEKTVKKTMAEYLTNFFFGLLYALWGYLLGICTLPFGASPFGIAFLSSATRRVPYIWAGLCLSALAMPHPVIRISAYSVVLLIRLLVRFTIDTPWNAREAGKSGEKKLSEILPVLFSEHLSLRMASACVSVFIIGLYFLVEGGFLYYDLYGTILAIAVCPVATLLFSCFFRDEKESQWIRFVGFLSIACALTYAARGFSVYGVSLSAFGALMITLMVTRKRGLLKGMLTGTLCGLCYSPLLAPVFTFGALCGSLLFPVSVTLGSLGVFAVGIWWGFYAKGISVLTGLTPALLAASLLFAVVDKLFLGEKDRTDENVETLAEAEAETKTACRVLAEDELDGVRLSDNNLRVKKLCESFSELSSVFEGMSRAMRKPELEDLRQICDSAFDCSCAGCPEKSVCWDEKYRETETQIGGLCATLHRRGKLKKEDVAEALSGRCIRLSDILDEINHNAAVCAEQVLRCDKTEIFASDYAAIADVLAGSMSRDEEEYRLDGKTAEQLAKALTERQIDVLAVAVYGGRQKKVLIRGESREYLIGHRTEIEETVRGICAFAVGDSIISERDARCAEMILPQKDSLTASFSWRTVRAAEEEEYCGDTVGIFRDGENKLYSFISDGMGSGREAAITSGICALFLQKMLTAGNGPVTSLRMLNGFLRNKGNGSIHECSATVDLMELDLIARRASFYKSGAAPTYVLRDGSLFKIRSKTLPIGILKEPDAKKISFDVNSGDVIVMVSDGVTQGKEECPWLFDLLRGNMNSLGAERCADLVMKYAKGTGSTDDLSVVIVKVD